MILILLLLPWWLHAAEPTYWETGISVVDKHEFYTENEPVAAPRDSWQNLFALTYLTRDLELRKDCVMFRVPGREPGQLKLKSIAATEDCQKHLLEAGDRSVEDIKELEYAVSEGEIRISFSTHHKGSQVWEVKLVAPIKTTPKMLMSSAEYKAGKVIMLAPAFASHNAKKPQTALTGKCHDIDDNCQEVSVSRCSQCAEGWYEIPNGCRQAPKFCGRDHCGEKGQHACRRGMKYQRASVEKFDCRMDTSFVYCKPGLIIHCEGSLAYCR